MHQALAICAALPVCILTVGLSAEPPGPPMTAPAASTAPAAATDPRLDELLDRLERRGETIHDLSCKVHQVMIGKTVGEKVTKEGELKYLRGGADGANARFHIHFSRIDQDGFKIPPETYVFDGRWFIEAKEATRNVIRREIVRPGERLNLFSVEDSPFPLPFGQKKEEILKHFEARIVPPAAADPPGTTHLECIPRAGTPKAEEYERIDFYVDTKLDLPIKIVALRKAGKKVTEEHTVTFPGLDNRCINRGLPASEFDYKPPRGWAVTEERLEAKPGR